VKIVEMWINNCRECPHFVFSALRQETICKDLQKRITPYDIDADCKLKDVNVIEGEICEVSNQ
jgi:hypothetical protein